MVLKQHIKKEVIISTEAEIFIVYHWLVLQSKLLHNTNVIEILLENHCKCWSKSFSRMFCPYFYYA